ncbi:MAG: hypothetical protein AB7O47_10080 [Flavobacteriales bacterium]
MTKAQQIKLKALIKKYNLILKESMEIALMEDLFNLIIVNADDKDFELKDMLLDKENLKRYIIKEFIRLNNKPITSQLKDMEEIKLKLVKNKQQKLNL